MNRTVPLTFDVPAKQARPLVIRPRSFALSGVFSKAVRLYRQLRRRQRAARAVIELSAMDDHMLRDIGISRDGIEEYAYHGRPAGDRR